MQLSERLFRHVQFKWNDIANKPFLRQMADGTLEQDRFDKYMSQDSCYLQSYIDLIGDMLFACDDDLITEFLIGIMQSTIEERDSLQVRNEDEELTGVGREYIDYLRETSDRGILYSLTALLQCSWIYAYIADSIKKRCPDETASSPYSHWFDSYTSEGYTMANDEWIALLDRLGEGLSEQKISELCGIFASCAEYESRFWDQF